jgi:hypothetical protein
MASFNVDQPASPEPGASVRPVDEPKRLGGYASPTHRKVGETEHLAGGLTVWDHYVIAAIPAIVARVNFYNNEEWALVGKTAAMVADLALVERKLREKTDEA